MDWNQQKCEAKPIPTLPGSSLSLYYDCLIDDSEDGTEQVGHALQTDTESHTDRHVAAADGADGEEGVDREHHEHHEQQQQLRPGEDADIIAYDDFGFLELHDPGLEAALNLQDPPPAFDATGLTTYNDLCRSMGLVPIGRFLRQINEGKVDLKFYGVNPRTIRAISQALMYNPSVHTLDLTGNWLTDEAIYYIAELLLLENIVLHCLIMKGCKLSARGAAMLAGGIEVNHSLRTLDLSDNELGDDGVEALQEALAQNDELRELNLSNNNLGAAAAASLGKALQENQTVEVLWLSRNNLFEDIPKGLRSLLRSIQLREKSLQLLDLAWNALNVPAAVPLRVFLVKSTVQRLFLNNNRFPGPAIDLIKIGVGKSRTLQHLKIGFNPMEPENAFNLLKACQSSETMQILDLDGIRVLPDFVKLKKQLEQSKGMKIFIEGILSGYTIQGPNLKEMMLKRARFEGLKPRKKKRRKDFGHLLLQLTEDGKDTLLPNQFTEAAIKKKKVKVREELLRALYEHFQTNKMHVDVKAMLSTYVQLFPDTALPPPVLKKKRKKRGKKKKKKAKL